MQPQQCRNRASVNIGGALYCAVHYPEKVQARQTTRDQAAQIDRQARESMHRRTRELEDVVRALSRVGDLGACDLAVEVDGLIRRARALFPDEK